MGRPYEVRCVLAAVCFFASLQPSPGKAILSIGPSIVYGDVLICSYVAETVICHRVAHAYRQLPWPFLMRPHGRR